MSQLIMCDLFPGREAVALYRWGWGESGACCQEGQFLIQQKSENLGQPVTFSPLPVTDKPLTLDERAAMAGRIYALEAELVEVRSQMHRLYTETEKLRSDNRMMEAQATGAKAALVLSEQRASQALTQYGEATGELATASDEIRSLKLMMPRPEEVEAVNEKLADLEERLAMSEQARHTLREALDVAEATLAERAQVIE